MLKFGTVWNYLVLGGMLACSACIGIYFWRQQQDSPDDTLLGGRNMHVIPVTFSLVGKSSNILDLNPSPLFPPILHLPSLLPPSFSNPFHPSYLPPSYPPAPSEFPLCDHPAGDAGGGVHPGHPGARPELVTNCVWCCESWRGLQAVPMVFPPSSSQCCSPSRPRR